MGSFNTTCAVSRLPIGMGDEVKVFVLAENPYQDTINCYTNDSWNLLGIPVDAVYDDYGVYDLVSEERNLSIWSLYEEYFRERLVEFSKVDYGESVSRNDVTFDKIQSYIWNGNAYIEYKFFDQPVKNIKLQIYAVHKKVYDSLSETFESWYGGLSLTGFMEKLQSHEDFWKYQNINEFLESYNEDDLETCVIDGQEDFTEEAAKLFDRHSDLEWSKRKVEDYGMAPPIFDDIGAEHIVGNKAIYNLLKYKIEDYFKFAEEHFKKYIFECSTSQLNISFGPIMTSGQDYNFDKQIAFFEKLIEVAKEKHNLHDNWDD